MTAVTTPKRTRKPARPAKSPAPSKRGSKSTEPETIVPESAPPRATTQPPSKIGAVIALLEREHGASLEELVAETGWQSHTTRAALTGLRKKGRDITSEKLDGVRRYHVAPSA